MNLKRFIALLFISTVGIIIFSTSAYTNNNGRAGNTGSPGENACNQCHNSNALNSGGGSVSISSPNMPNWNYFPGTTYTINVKVKKAGIGKFGFGFEALLPSGANGGIIQTVNSPNAKTLASTVLGNSRTNAVHAQPNHFGTDSLVFSFEWIAPAAGTGSITFYAAGNATNSANNSSGDFIYTANQIVAEASTINVQSMLANKKLTIFPNPTTDFISLSFPELMEQPNALLQIFDISGKLVHHQNINCANNNNPKAVSLDFLNAGAYFVHLQNGAYEHQEKIMIVK